MHHRLPTKIRLSKYVPNIGTTCSLCTDATEDDTLILSMPLCCRGMDGASGMVEEGYSRSVMYEPHEFIAQN